MTNISFKKVAILLIEIKKLLLHLIYRRASLILPYNNGGIINCVKKVRSQLKTHFNFTPHKIQPIFAVKKSDSYYFCICTRRAFRDKKHAKGETWRVTSDSLFSLARPPSPPAPDPLPLIFPHKCSRDDSLPIILKD